MAAHVGIDPEQDIEWITTDDVDSPMELFVRGEIDAYLAFVADFPELRGRKIGRSILNMALDKPWSQYFCCLWVGNADFVREYPVATKRALRAILKATDQCRTEPERAVRQMVDGGFIKLDHAGALQALNEIPWASWRELDPEELAALLRPLDARVRAARSDPQQDHRRRLRLALPEGAQARAEGVSLATSAGA